MPQHHVIQAGRSSQILLVCASDASSGAPLTGLRADAPGAAAAYLRAGDPAVCEVRLVAGEPGVYRSGGFAEVDPEVVPGVYQLGLPDEMLAEGATQAVLCLAFPGAAFEPIELALVAFDPEEPERIGMRCLEWEERWSFLRQGLPRLAEMEMALQQEAEPDQK